MELTVTRIIEIVAEYFKLEYDAVTSNARFGPYIRAKYIAIYLSTIYTRLPYSKIGEHFLGMRNLKLDHSTITHAVKSVSNQYETDRFYRRRLDEVKAIVDFESKLVGEIFQENDCYEKETTN
jgi:chromosomal replication initiator protein